MTPEFEKAWSDLNLRLRKVEETSGFLSAMRELETYHTNNGFIRDTLQELERYTFCHPADASRFLRVQYNPRRAQRFTGSRKTNGAHQPFQNGCFLCRENIEWQQNGTQIGYQVENKGRDYLALTNPFPLLPAHVVMASRLHRTQEWSLRDTKRGIDMAALLEDVGFFAERMPGYMAFYNGVEAGASIPGHLHIQCVMRPADEPAFPLEIAGEAAGGESDGPGLLQNYPLEGAVWKGPRDDVVVRAAEWITRWGKRNESHLEHLSANIIASATGEGAATLYFVPRERGNAKPGGFSGMIGALEIMGEIVFTSAEDKDRLDAGEIDYFTLEKILASVHTPIDAKVSGQ